MKQKKPLNLNPFVLIFAVVVVAWLFTFIITPGTLVDGVYTALPKNAFNFNNVFNLFRAVPMGIKDTSNLVILVLVIGGALEIYKSTGAIDSSITKMVHKFGSGSRTFLLIALMVLFSVIGGFLGWIETLIPFAPLVVAMILALGYDGIVACAVLIIGLMGGFVTGRHVAVLLSILAAMIMTVIGMQKGFGGVKWGIDDVSAVFLASALFSGIVGKLHPSEIANSFVKGAGGAVGGALVIGFARGVYWVMNSANINATIVYNATQLLKGLPPLAAAIGIVILVSFINGLIPSGSGKGALLAPIIVPIAMELGLTSQTAVLAYQFGDGITNMFWFSYGTLMIFLNYAKVPVQKWYKFFLPLMAIYFLFAFVSMGVAIAIGF